MEPSNTRSRRLHVEILRHDEIDEVDNRLVVLHVSLPAHMPTSISRR